MEGRRSGSALVLVLGVGTLVLLCFLLLLSVVVTAAAAAADAADAADAASGGGCGGGLTSNRVSQPMKKSTK